jgi:dihydroorotase-like cyclic amidohydrolase
MFPYLFSEGYVNGRIGLARLLQVVSEAAAKRYGLWDRKGSITPGKDADLVIVDPDGEWTIQGEAFYSKGKVTPFEGVTLRGRVIKTILRGQVIFSADEGITVDGGYGDMLRAHK